MTDISVINVLIERIRLEYANYWIQAQAPIPWKINIKNTEYVLIRKQDNTFIFDYDIRNLWVTHTLQEIHSTFKDSHIAYEYQLKIRNFINKLVLHNDLVKKNDQLEKKLDVIEDKFNIIITALDLQNQNTLNKI